MSKVQASAETRDITLVEAVNMALHRAMADDDNVVVLGEDIATNGGVFRATVGLKEAFGFKRVMDTPLAENLIAGTAIGMATQGLRPVAEFQFMGFIYAGMEQVISHAARMRNRTRGRLHCPLVFRAPFGGGIHAPEHHSESTEALFAHIPGLRVVIPSSPQRAYRLLLADIRNPDPVIFLEPKRIYRAVTQSVKDNGEALPLDTSFTLREGDDVTLITWGACVQETLQAADKLAEQGVSCEVIDVATVSPLDRETLLCSVAKTGRAVIVHEACRNGGVGAEVAASIAEGAFLDLQAPVVRVTGYDTIMPYYRNEQYYLPQVEDIIGAVEQVIAL
ncbi:MAG: pyruvate dehydrogenase E1 component subunit beta [Marinobacter excellens HL-55]|uniref:2-oxoisovalerate dehydrogenase subunit beta n=1 Tax=Marinobacter excellens HL-55 TaxID=1305731 RepID=A0A0P7YCF7_9GAMM|nr:MAG: pyruvate dehydrogenase E1 component subunit beta [Marinobacter excellens HL-55]